MSETAQHASPLLTPQEASELLHLNPRTLSNWRWAGKGPRYVRVGTRACYRLADLHAWLETQSFASTAQEAAARQALAPRGLRGASDR